MAMMALETDFRVQVDFSPVKVQNEVLEECCLESASVPITAAELDRRVTLLASIGGSLLFVLFSWMGVGTKMLFDMNGDLKTIDGDLKAIRQSIKDHGFGDVVSQLENSSSPQQLSAALGLVSAQIRVQEVNKVKPDLKKLNLLSAAVRKATLKAPDSLAVWEAGAQLVNYRSQFEQSTPPVGGLDCLDEDDPTALRQLENTPDSQLTTEDPIVFQTHDCNLNLDARASFPQTMAGRFMAEANRRKRGNGNYLVVTHARVTYSGGAMIPLTRVVFRDCVFDFKPTLTVPPKSGQFLTDQLLIADLSNANVTLPAGL